MSSKTNAATHHIYLLKTREFIKTGESIFKVGKTTQDGTRRLSGYPRGSQIILFMECQNSHDLERRILIEFKKKYILRSDIGREYFEGNGDEMRDDIYDMVKQPHINQDAVEYDEKDIAMIESVEDSDGSEDKEDSDTSHEKRIVVTTYEDYMKYSRIKEFIITSKKTREGYLRYPNQLWRYLHNIKHAERNGQETLDGFIRNGYNKNSIYKDTVTGILSVYDDIPSEHRRYAKYIEIDYRYDSIIKDILEKCYQPHPNSFTLEYHQFFVYSSKSDDKHSPITKLFDAKCKSFYSIEPYITGKYTTVSESSRNIRTNIDDMNIDIVDTIMRRLIPYSRDRNRYQQLCRYMLVDGSSSPYIFRDTCYIDNEHHQLSSWVSSMTYTLGIESIPTLDLESMRLKKPNLSAFIKENDNTCARCVCLSNIREDDIEMCVSEIKEKLGIMLFIVRNKTRDHTKTIYDFNAYEAYIRDNIEEVKQHIQTDQYYDVAIVARRENMDNLFYLTTMLFTHYMKWCIS